MLRQTPSEFRPERRRHSRTRTSYIATLNFGSRLLPCLIVDMSESGTRLQLLEPATLPACPAVLESTRFGKSPVHLVWQKGLYAGVRYTAVPATCEAPEPADRLAPSPRCPQTRHGFGLQRARSAHLIAA